LPRGTAKTLQASLNVSGLFWRFVFGFLRALRRLVFVSAAIFPQSGRRPEIRLHMRDRNGHAHEEPLPSRIRSIRHSTDHSQNENGERPADNIGLGLTAELTSATAIAGPSEPPTPKLLVPTQAGTRQRVQTSYVTNWRGPLAEVPRRAVFL